MVLTNIHTHDEELTENGAKYITRQFREKKIPIGKLSLLIK